MPPIVIIITRLMPVAPDTNLEAIKQEAIKRLEALGGKNISITEKPIAFGLKSVHVKTDMPEEKGTDAVEAQLATIPGVSSATIEDYRRAFG
jgi:translation elongation factor aEF-1 beta